MTSWQKVYATIYTFRLYGLAILLFCLTLVLLEAGNILPTRQTSVAPSSLKIADSTKLNMSRSTEFFGTVVTSSSSKESYTTVKVTLQAHEKSLLAEGDVLFVPGIGYGVVKQITRYDDSMVASVVALVQIETDVMVPGEQVRLYR